MKIFAFVFARGGSKGLPRKNIKPLCGKPLIQYAIETAKLVKAVNHVFVSTDDQEIASISSALGAIVIDRPKYLALDESKEWNAWQHAVNWAVEHYGQFDRFISLPATSPLRSPIDVEAALKKLDSVPADLCVSVTETNRSPYFNMVNFDDNGFISVVINPDSVVFRRQDTPKVFDMTTVVYATTPEFIMQNDSIFAGKVTAVLIPKERAVDIDDIYDFKLAEILMQERNIA
jgi:N-acylneuraminate cytidylyltransferase